jgi:hypothetical protein
MSLARMMQMAAAGSAGAGPEPSGWTDPDLGNASYDSVSFSVSGQETSPEALFFKPDGAKMYVLGTYLARLTFKVLALLRKTMHQRMYHLTQTEQRCMSLGIRPTASMSMI